MVVELSGRSGTDLSVRRCYADSCNGADHDTLPGGGLDNASVAGGSLAMCLSPAGAFDLSGNVKEWTSDQQGTSGPPNNEAIYVRGACTSRHASV